MYYKILSLISMSFILSTTAGANINNIPEGYLAITNKKSGTASFVNLKTKQNYTVNVGYLPHEIAVDGNFAYVSNYGNNHVRSTSIKDQPGNSVAMIDLSSFSLVKQIDLGPKICAPHGIVASREHHRVYVTCEARHEIVVIDTQSAKVLHSIPTNQAGSHMLVVDKAGARAYVANFWIGTVTVLDLVNKKILKQISTGRSTEGINLSPDERILYTTSVESNELVKIDTRALKVVEKKVLGASPIRVVALQNSKELVVNNTGDNSLLVVDSSNLEIVRKINVGAQPIGLVASSDSTHVYVANMRDNNISVVNIKTGEVTEHIKTGKSPDGIALF